MNWLASVNDWISSLDNDPERLRYVFVAALGLLGFTLTLAISLFARAFSDPVKKRIDTLHSDDLPTGASRKQYGMLQSLGRTLVPKAEEKKTNIALRLERAGYRSPQALTNFFGIKLLGLVVVPILVISVILLSNHWSVGDHLSLIVLSAVLAFVLPDFWLSRMVRRRQKHLRHALPDSIDLMVVCAEAGLGLNSAISRVAEEIGVQHPELAEELRLVMMQIRAGMDNRTALKELERRTGLDDIRAFVTTLLQAMRFGTSISESLRVFSDDMRDKRLQKAQEIAARLSITMLMPIALCMMPMFLLIVMGPPLLSLMRASTAISGGG